ncbi:hypothetical protein [Candidatus Merdisoma sp. JLR.KK006]|uniref:hypothetical protein n=1 Tax=Candidatus Merdisoma sp. JLR.KK006 TaxID=3112626 RepID=UPI002FF27D9D
MAFYRTCPKCGAALDPGEHCDCEKEAEKQEDFFEKQLRINPETGQYALRLGEIECEKV